MTRRALALLAVLLPVLALSSLSTALPARAEAVIDSSTLENDYPRALKFRVTASAPENVTDVTLSYTVVGRGSGALGKPTEITPARTLTAEVVVSANSSSNYLPVGSEIIYHWEITTADGKTAIGPDQTFLYLPPGKDWKTVSGEFMTVYYVGDDREALANAYLKAGVDTWQKIGVKLLNTKLKQTPVRVMLFDTEAQLNEAQTGRGSTFDAAVTTCGTKVASNIVFVIPAACGSPDRTDTLRHEFGHIINEAAGEGALGKLPSWVDEGTSVYAQSTAGDYIDAFQQGARANQLIPFGQMNTPSNEPRLVGVFYGQSYFMVKYLIDKGGPEKYALFFATIKKGNRFDDAIEQVYGFTLEEFEREFLTSVGSGRPAATATPRPQQQQQATQAPTQRPAQQTQPAAAPTRAPVSLRDSGSTDDGGGIGGGTIAIVGVAVTLVLFAVFSFFLMMFLQNQRKGVG